MSAKPDGGPAFPVLDIHQPWDRDAQEYCGVQTDVQASGMSLRDYFAAKAMHAELNTAGAFSGPAKALASAAACAGRSIEEQIAFNAYLLADAMLAEREREK